MDRLVRFKSKIVTQVKTYLDICLSPVPVEDYVDVDSLPFFSHYLFRQMGQLLHE